MTTHCNCDCDCGQNFTMVPVRGINLAIDNSVLGGEGIDYSFEEQFTGRLWVDGKKIYEKTVDTGSLPNTTTKNISHGVLGIDKFITMNGFALANAQSHFIPLQHVSDETYRGVMLYSNNIPKSITIRTFGNLSHYTESYVTIQYTCTDR